LSVGADGWFYVSNIQRTEKTEKYVFSGEERQILVSIEDMAMDSMVFAPRQLLWTNLQREISQVCTADVTRYRMPLIANR